MTLFGWSNQEEWGALGCSMYDGKDKCTKDFGGETWGKEQLGKPRSW